MPFQAMNRCLMASVWWGSDLRVSSLGLILVVVAEVGAWPALAATGLA